MKLKKNNARQEYERHLEFLLYHAKKNNLDFSLLLTSDLSVSESPPIRLSNKLKKNLKDRDIRAIERHRPYYYEWLINDALWRHLEGRMRVSERHKLGGNTRAEQKKLEKIIREAKITQTEEKLNTDGVKKLTNKRIAREIPGENEQYVRKLRAAWKKKEGKIKAVVS